MDGNRDIELHQELFLPLDIVQNSPGFSLDIGSSLMKIIYRSKEDFSNGEPINKEAVKNGKGRVYVTGVPRKFGPPAVADVILEKCDVKDSKNGPAVVPVTGIGANLLQAEFEEKLKVQFRILMEDVSLAAGFEVLLKYTSGSDLEYPIPEEGLKDAEIFEELFRSWMSTAGVTTEENYSRMTNLEHQLPDRDKRSRPCLLVNCGSATIIQMITEEGKMITIDGNWLAGKTMTNFAAYCLGKQSFGELMRRIEGADGATCDVTMRELVNTENDDDGDYSALKRSDNIVFYMGKLDSLEPDEVNKADMARSFFRLGSQNLAQMALTHAHACGVRRIYFTGAFISIPLARKFITTEIEGRNKIRPKNQQVEYHFVRFGGYCGALGAFFSAKK